MTNGKEWDKTQDWFWEGNVQNRIIEYMKEVEGFKIVKEADPLSKERGPDILAERRLNDGSLEIRRVAVKGYPSTRYVEGEKKGKKKRTNPSTQARHWFSEALLELLLAKSDDENLQVALGFPDFKVYTNLIRRIKWLRDKIKFFCYLVNEDGEVKLLEPKQNIR